MNHPGSNLGLARRLTLVLILCLVRFPMTPAQQKIPELIKWVQHISSLEAEVQREPRDLRLRVQLAEAQIKIGRFAAAEATLKEALRLKPDSVPALVAFGDLYRRRFQFDEALKTSDRIVKLAPQDVPGRLLAAQLAEVRMDFTMAHSIYKNVLQRNPKESLARYGIARIDYWENRFDDAQQQLKGVLSDDPHFAKGWLLLSQIHQIRQQDRENATCIRKAVECDPLDDTVHAVYADLLMREKKPAEGYAETRLALQLNPYSAGTHLLLGMGWSLRVYPAPPAIPAGKQHSLAEALKTNGSMLAHEFAHQVHGFLPMDLKDEIHRLYLEAMKTGKPLDFYAAFNEKEYFAQGVEAYVSEEKLADQKVTSGHTRRELQRRDPELFSFIQKLDARQGQTMRSYHIIRERNCYNQN